VQLSFCCTGIQIFPDQGSVDAEDYIKRPGGRSDFINIPYIFALPDIILLAIKILYNSFFFRFFIEL
jgi:hypothetical protein